MASLADINIRFRANLKEFSTQMQTAQRTLEKTGKKFQNLGSQLSVGLTLPLVAAGGAAIKFASDYEESLNKVDVAFGNSQESVKEFAKTTLQQFGIAEGTALDMASLFGDMATSMQIPQEEAAKMSTALVGLAGDLSSFKNISIGEATTALNAVFTGETESLKRLGVVMTQANLQQFAYAQGINKLVKNMTEAEKVQLRYNFVMSRTENAQGDFARTSDGAANQMRIFSESLKQLGQQIGSIILPVFTELTVKVNGIIQRFSNLSDETKKIIVVVAAFAAALGPAIVVIGTLIRNLSAIIPLIKALTVAIAANPIGAFAVALTALAGGLLLANSRLTPLTNATDEFNKLTAAATQNIAKEKAELEKYLNVAKNDKLSKNEREEAIKKLNALSPKYLGDLTLEKINTQEATDATKKYTEALLQKAKVQAAEEKLVEVQKKILDLQLGTNEAVNPSIYQNLKNNVLSFGDAGQLAANTALTVADNTQEETKQLKDLESQLLSLISVNKNVGNSNDEVANSLKAIATATKISDLKEYLNDSNSVIKSAAEKRKKELINLFKKDPKPTVETSLAVEFDEEELAARLEDLDTLQDRFNEFGQATEDALSQAGETRFFDGLINHYDEGLAQIDERNEVLAEKMQRLKEVGEAVGEAVGGAFLEIGNGIVESMGLADKGFQGFVKNLAGTVTKLISMMLAQALATSISNSAQSAAGTGPAAVFTQPVFMTTLISGVLAAFAAIPKFELGGIVGGNSFYGDKILARVNSGELILNRSQQERLYNQMQPIQDTNVRLSGGALLKGSDIYIALERYEKEKNRIS